LNKRQVFNSFLSAFLFLFVLFLFSQCSKPQTAPGPTFTIQNQRVLVPNIISNYVCSPRFDPNSQTVIFNARLDGDSWDGIYTIPTNGGDYRKILEANDDLYFPSFSQNGDKIIYCQGFSRQIMVYDIAENSSEKLPIFGNTPVLLADNETVLYSGVIDANLKLYHIPSRQSRNLTESYISANFASVVLSDNIQLHWIEKMRNGVYKLVGGDIGSNSSRALWQSPRPLRGLTTSPGGQWNLINFSDGSLLAINSKDTSIATVSVQNDDPKQKQTPLISLPDWSISGNKVVYTSVLPEKYSTTNPFFKNGHFQADLVIADIRWDKISNADIIRSLQPQPVILFSEKPPEKSQMSTEKRNNPPKILSTPPKTAIAGEMLVYRISAVDIDLFDDLVYRKLIGPPESEVLSKTGILYWIAGEPGDYRFTVEVSDGITNDRQSFGVTVLPNPDWDTIPYVSDSKPGTGNEYLAGFRFVDSNDDGFLTPGESAGLLIDLKTRDTIRNNVSLQLLISTSAGEIEIDRNHVFPTCIPDRWSRKIIPIKGLDNLQNRPIIIRGLLQDSIGIRFLPASLIISAKNPVLSGN